MFSDSKLIQNVTKLYTLPYLIFTKSIFSFYTTRYLKCNSETCELKLKLHVHLFIKQKKKQRIYTCGKCIHRKEELQWNHISCTYVVKQRGDCKTKCPVKQKNTMYL